MYNALNFNGWGISDCGDWVRIVVCMKKKAFSVFWTTLIQKIGMDFAYSFAALAAIIVEGAQQNVSWKQVR